MTLYAFEIFPSFLIESLFWLLSVLTAQCADATKQISAFCRSIAPNVRKLNNEHAARVAVVLNKGIVR